MIGSHKWIPNFRLIRDLLACKTSYPYSYSFGSPRLVDTPAEPLDFP